ncbi:hypothetical protein [Pelagerythrobacter rhizovicinus]|uniref:hypothetical protein n=1 Tax=Pelagerythrobacter rhizovicinus TaxID=2268576 RepID=UPI0013EB2AF6|nr:hypothetical protein [Pelagerythrobacter rhizovicinus]
MQRIETALGRIAKAADDYRPAPPSVSGLVVEHGRLREAATGALKELDELIERLER